MFRLYNCKNGRNVARTAKKTGGYFSAEEMDAQMPGTVKSSSKKNRQGYTPVRVAALLGGGKVRSCLFFNDLKKLTQERYSDMLCETWLSDMADIAKDGGFQSNEIFFMRDNDKSRCPCAEDFAGILDRVIEMSPRSPDLMPQDYWLWDRVMHELEEEEEEYLKKHDDELVETMDEFCARIERVMFLIPEAEVNAAVASMKRRIPEIIQKGGALLK